MKIIPLQKYVLLEVSEYTDDPSKSGVIVPQKYRKKIPKGKVLMKGKYAEGDFDVGDTVIFSKQGTKALPENQILAPDYRILLKGKP